VIEHELKPLLIGQDPLKIEYLWQLNVRPIRQHGRRGIVMHAIIAASTSRFGTSPERRRACRSIVLFGAFTDQVEVYASGGVLSTRQKTSTV